jgi:hypothetical protein
MDEQTGNGITAITALPPIQIDNNVVYEVALRLFTNTNFDLLEMPVDEYAKLCIIRAMAFNEAYTKLKQED